MKKGLQYRNPFSCLARPAGFEPTTPWFVAKYSIQLSYGREARIIAGASCAPFAQSSLPILRSSEYGPPPRSAMASITMPQNSGYS